LGTSYGNEISFSTSTVNIGDTYGGGVVFYIDATGRHGVVCATYDQGNFQWLPAIIFCSNLNLNGYDDWFLPSIGELGLMYNLRGQLGNFSGTYYWSSTQNGPNNAWYVHFAHGFTSSNASTSNTFQVRAVRAF
jgi:protein phosphatase/serine/threonine-protein kinase